MKRRLVILTTLVGVVGGSAAAAMASGPARVDNHNICLVMAQNENYNNTQDICVTLP
jgi:hypothetical protein